jgi:hypothetical protein
VGAAVRPAEEVRLADPALTVVAEPDHAALGDGLPNECFHWIVWIMHRDTSSASCLPNRGVHGLAGVAIGAVRRLYPDPTTLDHRIHIIIGAAPADVTLTVV